MNFSNQTSRALALVTILTILIVTQTFPAQAFQLQDRKPQFPARTGHVNDFAGVLDASTKQRIENTLGNLQQRAGIDFVIAIIKTAGDQDVFDYSQLLTDDWDVGSKNSKQKSLLLVIAADTGKFFTQSSRNVRGDLPDGLIGEMGRHMRLQFEAREYNDGLTSGIRAFVNEMAEQKGLSLAGIDQPPAEVAQSTPAETPAVTPAITPEVQKPQPAEIASQTPAATPEVPTATPEVPTPKPDVVDAKTPPPSDAGSARPTDEAAKPTAVVKKPELGADDAETVELTLTLPAEQRI